MIEDTTIETLKGAIIKTDEADTRFDKVALYFDYIEDETLSCEASITDNYVESNYAIQDHIAIKPKVYRLRGCVGEIVYQNEFEWLKKIEDKIYNNPILNKTVNKTKPIPTISPVVSNYTQLAINIVKQLESSYKRYKRMIDDFKNKIIYKNERQQMVVAILNQMLQNRVAVKLTNLKYDYNPFKEGQYNKLYFLQSVSAHQGANDFITDIEVTIKEFRIATTKVTKLDKSKFGVTTVTDKIKTTTQNEGTAKTQDTNIKISNLPVVKQVQEGVKWMAEGKTKNANICKSIYLSTFKYLVNPLYVGIGVKK